MDESALIRILTEPKNALIKQYRKLLAYEGVQFDITDDALSAIANQVIERETGARGLRAVMEKIMLETMYTLPSLSEINTCQITEDTVLGNSPPELINNAPEALKTA